MKQDDWPEGAWKDCPHTSDLNHRQSMYHSLSLSLFLFAPTPAPTPPPPGSACAFYTPVFSIDTYLPHHSQSLCQILSPKGQVLQTYIKWLGFSIFTPQTPEDKNNETP